MMSNDWHNDLIRYIDQLIIKLSSRKSDKRNNSNGYNNSKKEGRSKYSQNIFMDLIYYIYNLKNTMRFSNESMNITNMIIYNKIGYFIKEQILCMITSNFNINDDVINNNENYDGVSNDNNNINKDNLKIFHLINELQWNKCYREQYILSFIKIIELKIILICNENIYNIKYLEQLDSFIKIRLMKYIKMILYNNYNDSNNDINNQSINSLEELINELIYISLDLYIKYRSKSLFEIIADYPDSLNSIQEFKYILHKTNNISYVGKNFRIILQKRLLHIGASTSQILEYYILLIKILRFIDNHQSSDILLDYITKPIRKYLLLRHDTIKCIITSILTSNNSNNNNNHNKGDDDVNGIESNLYLELKHGGSLEYSPDEDDEDNDGYCENWEPRKRNKDLIENNNSIINNNNNDKISSSNKSRNMDTLALLVSIFGSTDLFIIEYRSLLADKLLNSTGFITDHEVTNLELLKIRYIQL